MLGDPPPCYCGRALDVPPFRCLCDGLPWEARLLRMEIEANTARWNGPPPQFVSVTVLLALLGEA